MTVTYHRNTPNCGRLRLLSYLQDGGEPNIKAMARRLSVNQGTIRKHLKLLEFEGLVIVQSFPGTPTVIMLTAAGESYQVPEEARETVLLPCGHPKTELPFCLPCRNAARREYCRESKWLPVLRVQMRRP